MLRGLLAGMKRFGALRKALADFLQNMLTATCATKSDELLTCTAYAGVPPRVRLGD